MIWIWYGNIFVIQVRFRRFQPGWWVVNRWMWIFMVFFFSRWWQLKDFLCSPRKLGKIPILTSIFFRWVETTNQETVWWIFMFFFVFWKWPARSGLQGMRVERIEFENDSKCFICEDLTRDMFNKMGDPYDGEIGFCETPSFFFGVSFVIILSTMGWTSTNSSL